MRKILCTLPMVCGLSFIERPSPLSGVPCQVLSRTCPGFLMKKIGSDTSVMRYFAEASSFK